MQCNGTNKKVERSKTSIATVHKTGYTRGLFPNEYNKERVGKIIRKHERYNSEVEFGIKIKWADSFAVERRKN